jgi:hypothetical protein
MYDLLTVEIPEGWELQFSENPIFGPNFFYSLLRPKKYQNRNKVFFVLNKITQIS